MVSQLNEITYENIALKPPDLCEPTLLPKVPLGTAEASWTTEAGMLAEPRCFDGDVGRSLPRGHLMWRAQCAVRALTTLCGL